MLMKKNGLEYLHLLKRCIRVPAGNVQMNQSIESILRLALNWEQVNGIRD